MTLDALIHCPEKHHLHDPTVKEREQRDSETEKERERGKGRENKRQRAGGKKEDGLTPLFC